MAGSSLTIGPFQTGDSNYNSSFQRVFSWVADIYSLLSNKTHVCFIRWISICHLFHSCFFLFDRKFPSMCFIPFMFFLIQWIFHSCVLFHSCSFLFNWKFPSMCFIPFMFFLIRLKISIHVFYSIHVFPYLIGKKGKCLLFHSCVLFDRREYPILGLDIPDFMMVWRRGEGMEFSNWLEFCVSASSLSIFYMMRYGCVRAAGFFVVVTKKWRFSNLTAFYSRCTVKSMFKVLPMYWLLLQKWKDCWK